MSVGRHNFYGRKRFDSKAWDDGQRHRACRKKAPLKSLECSTHVLTPTAEGLVDRQSRIPRMRGFRPEQPW